VKHNDFRHDSLSDRQPPFFLGDVVGFRVRIKNMLAVKRTGKFFYLIFMPDGTYLNRPVYPVDFEPNEEKVIPLGDPVFCAFLGIFRMVLV